MCLTQEKHACMPTKTNKSPEHTLNLLKNLSTVIPPFKCLEPNRRWMLLMPVKKSTWSGCCALRAGLFVRTRSNDSLPPPGRELVYNNAVVIWFIIRDEVQRKLALSSGVLRMQENILGFHTHAHTRTHTHNARKLHSHSFCHPSLSDICFFAFVFSAILQNNARKKISSLRRGLFPYWSTHQVFAITPTAECDHQQEEYISIPLHKHMCFRELREYMSEVTEKLTIAKRTAYVYSAKSIYLHLW